MSKIKLVSYIPQTASYQIFHPKDFLVNEDDDGIVTITSPLTYSNLTLSGYHANQDVTEEMLFNFFQLSTEGYTSQSDVKKEMFENRLLFEGRYKQNNVFWVWWAISESNQIISASINSENELSEEDYNLYRFMLDQMEIYPEEFEK